MAEPEANLVAFTSDTVNVFHIGDEMACRGWYVQPQLAFEASKENIHLSINPASVKWVDALITDLGACVEAAKKLESGEVTKTIQEAFSSIDPNTLTPETFSQMLGMAGIEGYALPERMATINEMLNALPAELREGLVTEFINELLQYREDSGG